MLVNVYLFVHVLSMFFVELICFTHTDKSYFLSELFVQGKSPSISAERVGFHIIYVHVWYFGIELIRIRVRGLCLMYDKQDEIQYCSEVFTDLFKTLIYS